MPDAQRINSQISTLENTQQPSIEFIETIIKDFKNSAKRKLMLTAQDYYQNDNDIINRKITYIDETGLEQESTLLSNNKLSHPSLRKIINQKISYLLAKDFSITSEDADYVKLLNDKFDDKFKKVVKNVARDAIINGIGWLQVYYNSEGNLNFKRIKADEVIPFWHDADHTILKALLRFYVITNYDTNGEPEEITKIEYYTDSGVWHFIGDDDGLRLDTVKGNYKMTDDTGEIKDVVWGKIPFIAFKYAFDEIPLLKLIKPLIDNYDYITSDTGNNIQDIPNSIKVVINYDGTNKEEFNRNLATHRVVFIRSTDGSGGDVKTLTTPFDITTVDGHLNRLRRDIYDLANAVDMQELNVGNKSGEALKFKFADLDMDTEDFGSEIQASFQELSWFIKEDALLKGKGDFTESKFNINFNKDIIINELEAMDICVKAQSIHGISQQTILDNVPLIRDAEKEIARFNKEQADAIDDMEKFRRALGDSAEDE